MKKALTALLAGGFVVAVAGAGLACPYHSASAEHNLTVAQSLPPASDDEEAMTTYDPGQVKLEDEEKAD